MEFNNKPTVTADGSKQPIVINDIIVRPIKRENGDLVKWKNNTQSAESSIPRRVGIYDMYADYSTRDAQIIACWQKRLDPILSAPWIFTDKDGNPVDQINEVIDCIGFEDLLTEIMSSKPWGYAMCEPTFFLNDNDKNEFSLYSVPKKHMRPHLGIIAREQNGNDGINIREGIYAKSIMEFGKVDDLGLLLSATMYAILKAGNLSDWAEFIEIFGHGIIDAVWEGFDPTQKVELQKAFDDLGGKGIIIRPKGTELTIANNTGNANGDLQNKFADKMDEYISKVLLGTTESIGSTKSSGYAQSKVHQEEDEKKNETDLNFVRRNLNSRFIKVLKAQGFDTKGGTFILKQSSIIDKDAQYIIHKSMAFDLNIPIDDDFFYEEYGMPRPQNYEALKKQALEQSNAALQQKAAVENAPTPPASKGKKDKQPVNPEDNANKQPSALRKLLRLFHSASVLENPIAEASRTNCCGEVHTINELVTLSGVEGFISDKVFDELANSLIRRAYDAKGKFTFDSQLFDYTSKVLTSAFIDGWRKQPLQLINMGFDYNYTDPAILTSYETNLFRFAGVKTVYQAKQLNDLYRKSKSFDEFYRSAKNLVKIQNRDWLRNEYDTASAVAESSATYNRLIKQVDIFPYWEYKTIGDDKVRIEHQLLDGLILPANHPFWKILFPPNGWNCRCYVVPRTKAETAGINLKDMEAKANEYFSSEGFKKSEKAGFAVNRGDDKLVFTENQNYITNNLEGNKKLDELRPIDFGLKELDERAAMATNKIEPYAKSSQSYFDDNNENGKLMLRDYNNRPIEMTKGNYQTHVSDDVKSRSGRVNLLNELPNILKSPDEVWLRSKEQFNETAKTSFNRFLYIKYYEGKPLAVFVELKNGVMVLKTWFEIVNPLIRFGLLIK